MHVVPLMVVALCVLAVLAQSALHVSFPSFCGFVGDWVMHAGTNASPTQTSFTPPLVFQIHLRAVGKEPLLLSLQQYLLPPSLAHLLWWWF